MGIVVKPEFRGYPEEDHYVRWSEAVNPGAGCIT